MRRASIAAVMTATLALAAGPAMAQSGAGGAGGQAGTSGTGSGQSSPTGGQAGTSGAGGATSIPGGGQSAGDEMSNPQGASASRANDRQEFIEKAALASMSEIQLGQLAVQNAQDTKVKEFAQTMVDEHTKALTELREAAAGASLPSSIDKKHQKVHDKLAKLQGAEFDRAYMDAMVDSHKDTEKLLKKRVGNKEQSALADTAAQGGAGAVGTSGQSGTAGAVGTSGTSSEGASAIDAWAATTLPKVQGHLEHARSLEDQVKQAGAPANDGAAPTATPGATPPQQQ